MILGSERPVFSRSELRCHDKSGGDVRYLLLGVTPVSRGLSVCVRNLPRYSGRQGSTYKVSGTPTLVSFPWMGTRNRSGIKVCCTRFYLPGEREGIRRHKTVVKVKIGERYTENPHKGGVSMEMDMTLFTVDVSTDNHSSESVTSPTTSLHTGELEWW